MDDFNDKDLENLSIDEINELYKDILEMPAPLIGGIASESPDYCTPKGGFTWA